jgi:cell division septation protein DedD
MANEFLARNEEIVGGIYRLGALISRSARGTIYETQSGETKPGPAVIKIREFESDEADYPGQQMRNAGQLEHPNLLKVYATGSSILDDVPISYMVMERADESLQEVLATRALTGGETLDLLVPVLEALQYLHKNGYAHSGLKPSNVLAVNDQLKLSPDSVIRVDAGGSPAEDMRALGVLIAQALKSQERQELGKIPQPLADIVRRCLDPDSTTRWTVEQVKARLNAPAIEPVRSTGQPVLEKVPRSEKMPRSEEDPEAGGLKRGMPRGVPKWIYAGLAALILTVVLAAVVRNRDSAPVAMPPVATPPVATPMPPDPASGAVSPSPVKPVPRAEAPLTGSQPDPGKAGSRPDSGKTVSRPDSRKASGWSVIVGAYGSREPAEKWGRQMTKRWPKFEFTVLETQAEKTRYLVVLGQNLSEDQAEALRKRAVESGLTRNTYIKRVM